MSEETRPDLASLKKMSSKPRGRRWLWPVVILLCLGAGGWYLVAGQDEAHVIYNTEPATRGDLTVTVIATGTVQPTTQVELSSELSGTLAAVNVDYNDTVTEGQILARLDDIKLRAAVTNAHAQLASARARLASAEATVNETAETLASSAELDKRGLNARLTFVAAQAAHQRAVAAVEIAKADVTLAEANLESQEADLEKAEIRSPISGVVLSRSAEKGQIVAATLNAPILFVLAEDLQRMELQVSVDEADIGRVDVGQQAVFTVDAYPGREFDATITSVRFAPDDTADVVSYTAVLSVDNDELLLRPGMTATATITVERLEDVLTVPMTALRYAPPVTASSDSGGRGLVGLIMPSRARNQRRGGGGDGSSLWVLRGGTPERVSVDSGAADGSRIVVRSDALSEGDAVITSQREAS